MSKVLVTGGCGYIGVHTIVDLINEGFDIISIDNNSRSDEKILDGCHQITGKKVKNYKTDLCDLEATKKVFEQNPDITAVIHFAAYKSVPESVKNPLLYFHNNIDSLLNILICVQEFKIPHFVFSSSCSVYGDTKDLPVTEESTLGKAASPYGRTKVIGEEIIQDFSKVNNINYVLLRYFNPVGAHESALIGEVPYGEPENLVPGITQFAIGKMKELIVHGNDYDTRDGTCIRDYIHVMDIAHAHTKALQYLQKGKNESNYEIYNLGFGNGVTVMEAIQAFEKVSGKSLNYKVGPRRPGDVPAIYANNDKARDKLCWQPERTIEDMMLTAWKWQCNMEK